MSAVTVKACRTCSACVKVLDAQNVRGTLQCHAQPPQIVSVSVAARDGVGLVPAVCFPQVGPDEWCRQWEQGDGDVTKATQPANETLIKS